jgi:hypothetical protein
LDLNKRRAEEKKLNNNKKFVFVLGSPRSGTTLMGNYIGSSPEVDHIGEYLSFHLYMKDIIKEKIYKTKDDCNYTEKYITEFEKFSINNMSRIFEKRYIIESSPWTLFYFEYFKKFISEVYNDCYFILVLRNYRDIIMSLTRSYNEGRQWAGSNLIERAKIWSNSYMNINKLPLERTIILSYDQLCTDPKRTIDNLNDNIKKIIGIDSSLLDLGTFSKSWASGKNTRKTIAYFKDEEIMFNSKITNIPNKNWDSKKEDMVRDIVKNTNQLIFNEFGDVFSGFKNPVYTK